ncbi:hypothetical protein VW35_11820 [Devosia soli]|uniref:2-dehydropantoate 2-reductase n=1 Tax=Devosia soli TaxID=361041 RepID=A0A0F5L7C9_9HYPH|nr:2-dehydropantoate 2-reductase [Devosia soli]KKB78316.1 hypothetical protein VW35_11820 [Devosia soli]
MPSLAIVGTGAIGGTVAAWLAQDPALDLTLCARTPFDSLEVTTPNRLLKAAPRLVTDPADVEPVDWVLVATKTYDADSTKPWLDRLLGPQTRVAVIQNGVEHRALFAHLVPAERILPVIINLPVARTAPGRMVQHRRGVVAVPDTAEGRTFAGFFANTEIEAAAHRDFTTQAWLKLTGNAIAIVPTLTLRATGPVWSPELERIVRGVVEECAAVGRAEGAIIPQDFVEKTIETSRTMPEGATGGSLHADRLAGNRLELDARNGVIVRLGRQHGISTPMNELLVTLLGASGAPWIKGQAL